MLTPPAKLPVPQALAKTALAPAPAPGPEPVARAQPQGQATDFASLLTLIVGLQGAPRGISVDPRSSPPAVPADTPEALPAVGLESPPPGPEDGKPLPPPPSAFPPAERSASALPSVPPSVPTEAVPAGLPPSQAPVAIGPPATNAGGGEPPRPPTPAPPPAAPAPVVALETASERTPVAQDSPLAPSLLPQPAPERGAALHLHATAAFARETGLDASPTPPATTSGSRFQAVIAQVEGGEQVASRVAWLVKDGIQGATLRLHPPELGTVEVRISIADRDASVLFTTASDGARDAIEAALPRLRQMLGDNGLNLTEVDVSRHAASGSQDDGRAARDQPANPPERAAEGDVEDEEAPREPEPGTHRVGLIDQYA